MKIKLFTRHEHFRGFFGGHTLVESTTQADLIVSYDWPKIINLEGIPGINLHIAYLPYNRGADPNLWSWLENTPKGITIHWMDASIDTGNILVQKKFSDEKLAEMTLSESYRFLHEEIEKMFLEHFPKMLDFEGQVQEQTTATTHYSKELVEAKRWLAERQYQVFPKEFIQYWKK